jgi:acetoin utilization protein AcuB
MRAVDLISHSIPNLRLQDTVRRALQLMADFHIAHLPVVGDDKFLGMVEENELMDVEDEAQEIGSLDIPRLRVAILQDEHFLSALRLWKLHKISIIPVIKTDGEFVGVISSGELLSALDEYIGADEPGGIIQLSMEPRNFSLGEVGRLVESNDASVIHIVTYKDPNNGQLLVSIKVNRNDIQDIIATFQRYEYTIEAYYGDNLAEDDLRANYAHLMNYLNI